MKTRREIECEIVRQIREWLDRDHVPTEVRLTEPIFDAWRLETEVDIPMSLKEGDCVTLGWNASPGYERFQRWTWVEDMGQRLRERPDIPLTVVIGPSETPNGIRVW